jgi:hypothetical protein
MQALKSQTMMYTPHCWGSRLVIALGVEASYPDAESHSRLNCDALDAERLISMRIRSNRNV